MKLRWQIILVTMAILLAPQLVKAQSPAKVQTRPLANGTFEVWHVEREQWISPEIFWERYAAQRGGITWGKRPDYPAYGVVKELDTLWIELEQGPCLMEFYHSRWRRANDVRRWDDAFNQYGGCPHVFD